MPRHNRNSAWVLVLCALLLAGLLGCVPSQMAEPEPLPDSIVRDLTAKENAVWDAFKQKDKQRLARLIADDYVAVGDRGPIDKAATIASLDNRSISDYSLRDIQATLLGSNQVLLTYKCRSKGDQHGAAFDLDYLCTDIWISRSGAWQSIFFEDRPLAERSSAVAKY